MPMLIQFHDKHSGVVVNVLSCAHNLYKWTLATGYEYDEHEVHTWEKSQSVSTVTAVFLFNEHHL